MVGRGGCVLQLPSPDSYVQEKKSCDVLKLCLWSYLTVLSLGYLDAWSPGVPKLWVVSVLAPTLSSSKTTCPMPYLNWSLSSLSKMAANYVIKGYVYTRLPMILLYYMYFTSQLWEAKLKPRE